MKNGKKRKWLLPAVAALGILAMALRMGLYALAADRKGLLVSGHPLETALWAVVLAGAALIVLAVFGMDGSARYEDNFRSSGFAAAGNFLMGAAVAMTAVLDGAKMTGPAAAALTVLGCGAAAAFLAAGYCRLKGKKPFFLTHAVGCVFLLLNIVVHYRSWSGDPQLQDYIFDLLAGVMLMLFCYYTAMFEADAGKRRMQLATGLMAVLFGLTAQSDSEFFVLCVSGVIWAASDLCTLEPRPKESGETDEAP